MPVRPAPKQCARAASTTDIVDRDGLEGSSTREDADLLEWVFVYGADCGLAGAGGGPFADRAVGARAAAVFLDCRHVLAGPCDAGLAVCSEYRRHSGHAGFCGRPGQWAALFSIGVLWLGAEHRPGGFRRLWHQVSGGRRPVELHLRGGCP